VEKLSVDSVPGVYFIGERIVPAILRKFILAEKVDLFHTPNLRYLKNIRFIKVYATLRRLTAKSLIRLDFYIQTSPTVAGARLPITISWVPKRALAWLLEFFRPILKIPIIKSHQDR
jgi:hypothetical protein